MYGIECSAIAEQAATIVADNGYTDRVTIVRGKVEDVELPVDSVDIIISEWMGYFLLYESMLDTVLVARDRWLAPGGLMLPDRCTLYAVGIEDAEYRHEKIDFWDNVYGFDFKTIKKLAMAEPLVDTVDADQVATQASVVRTFDINTMTKEDATFTASAGLWGPGCWWVGSRRCRAGERGRQRGCRRCPRPSEGAGTARSPAKALAPPAPHRWHWRCPRPIDGAAVARAPSMARCRCLCASADVAVARLRRPPPRPPSPLTPKHPLFWHQASFELTATRNDYVHALVCYFDVEFGGCHKPVYFTTAPQ